MSTRSAITRFRFNSICVDGSYAVVNDLQSFLNTMLLWPVSYIGLEFVVVFRHKNRHPMRKYSLYNWDAYINDEIELIISSIMVCFLDVAGSIHELQL